MHFQSTLQLWLTKSETTRSLFPVNVWQPPPPHRSLSLSLSFGSWFISNVPFAIKPRGSSLKTDRPGKAGVSQDHQSCMDATVAAAAAASWLGGRDENKAVANNLLADTRKRVHAHTHGYTNSQLSMKWHHIIFFCVLFPFQSPSVHTTYFSTPPPHPPPPSLSSLSLIDILAH